MSTPITTTVHLYPGTPRERQVKVEALVSLHYGRYRIDRLNPLEGGTIGAHELGEAYDAVIDEAHAYHGRVIPEQEKRGGFALVEILLAFVITVTLAFVAVFVVKEITKPAFAPLTPPVVVSTSSGQDVYLITSRHDNHLFVTSWRGGLLHHPDCGCVKAVPSSFPLEASTVVPTPKGR